MVEIPKHLLVKKDLKRSIAEGKYEVGTILPSENELSSQYNISRMTARNAMNSLEAEGFVRREKGKGSFVRPKHQSLELLSLKGFTEVMKDRMDDIGTVIIQKPTVCNWEEEFNWSISGLEQASACIHFSRIRTISGLPIMLEKTWLPDSNLPDFCSTPFENDSLFDTLIINHDIEITGTDQKFRAIPADEEAGKYLNLDSGIPVLEIIRKLTTSRVDFFIYSLVYCHTEEFAIEI